MAVGLVIISVALPPHLIIRHHNIVFTVSQKQIVQHNLIY